MNDVGATAILEALGYDHAETWRLVDYDDEWNAEAEDAVVFEEEARLEGGFLFLRDDGQAGCPSCGTVFATTHPTLPTVCPICEYDRVVDEWREMINKARVAMSAGAGTIRKTDIDKVGRNDPCYCGSGKKRKKCHPA